MSGGLLSCWLAVSVSKGIWDSTRLSFEAFRTPTTAMASFDGMKFDPASRYKLQNLIAINTVNKVYLFPGHPTIMPHAQESISNRNFLMKLLFLRFPLSTCSCGSGPVSWEIRISLGTGAL